MVKVYILTDVMERLLVESFHVAEAIAQNTSRVQFVNGFFLYVGLTLFYWGMVGLVDILMRGPLPTS